MIDVKPSVEISTPSRETGVVSQVVGSRRFLAASGALLLMVVGWYVLVWWLGVALDKLPIPWPDGPHGVEVDDRFMMTNFPEVLPAIAPRYVLLSSRYMGPSAIPESEAISYLNEETRLTLGVGRPSDAPRRADRGSNWYMSRKFGDLHRMSDTRQRDINDIRFWQLDLTYYTGAVDVVAHVPGRCMIAAGATPVHDQTRLLDWELPPNALGWEKVRVVRSVFEAVDAQGRQSNVVQYYTFSINGRNEEDWRKVRLRMTADIRQKYVYFSKLQFAPLAANIEDFEAADEDAREFFRVASVEAMRKFPSADTVTALNQASQASEK